MTWICNANPRGAAAIVPDTTYFAQFLTAEMHHQRFIDRDEQQGGTRLHSEIEFIAIAYCSGDGFLRLEHLPSLPYIVSMALPPQLASPTRARLVAHVQLSINKQTDVELSNKDLIGPNDAIQHGHGIDYTPIKNAYSRLPQPSMEGIAAEQALAAIDRGDLRAAAAATIQYVDACVKVQKCADSLRLSLLDEFQKNRGWFEFFGTLATAGLAGETVAATATEEEIGLSRIGEAFRKSAVTTTGETATEATISSSLGRVIGSYDALNLGPLSANLAETFSGGRYRIITLKQDTILYRAGSSNTPLGEFFVSTPPQGIIKSRIDSAILPTWSSGASSPIDSAIAVKIPAGTNVYVGTAGSQGGFYVGGTEQIVVPKPWSIPGVTVQSVVPLK